MPTMGAITGNVWVYGCLGGWVDACGRGRFYTHTPMHPSTHPVPARLLRQPLQVLSRVGVTRIGLERFPVAPDRLITLALALVGGAEIVPGDVVARVRFDRA